MNAAGARAQPAISRSLGMSFEARVPRAGQFTVGADLDALRAAIGPVGAVLIEHFPLEPGLFVDLEVERFWVTAPGCKFVEGGARGDSPIAFDPGQVLLLRGRIRGFQRSHVFLGLSNWGSNGFIELGTGRAVYGVSSRGPGAARLPAGQLSVFRCIPGKSRNPIPYCTVVDPGAHDPGGFDAPVRGLRQLELAVETDHEFWQLFEDTNATNAYIVQMYGAVSDIFVDQIKVRVDLSYVRVWPEPNEPFAAGSFISYWSSNMQAVHRDLAQMFSGRADLPGGNASLNSVCGGYSFCGNAVGYFADPQAASVLNYDPMVAAHELGHNCGSSHTDAYGLDNCGLPGSVTPQRGTIMSYCNQTVSGGMANIDMGFHKVTQNAMRNHTYARPCIVFDCNQNSIRDSLDISSGVSQDANTNGIPDECEDCNGNTVLDSVDIASGTSFDLNANGIPDECEPDCNGNNVPDDRDILLGISQDLHGDNIPDECDADRNNNDISDYNEIMASMPLDKDRDRLIDSTQDCDNDQVPDLVELDGAHDVWLISNTLDVIKEYHSVTGVLIRAGDSGRLSNAQDLVITPDRRVLVSSAGGDSVVEFDHRGQFVRTLVAPGAGGLAFPTGLLRTPAGTLLVASSSTSSVLEFDLATGALIRTLVAPAAGGLAGPFGMAFSPTGTLLVTSSDNRVLEFDASTGAFVRTLVAAGSGGLLAPHGIAVKPDGRLLVASHDTDQVLEYEAATGAFIRPFLVTGLPVLGAWTIRIGPDGMVYVSGNDRMRTHFTNAYISIHDPRTGNFVRSHVQARDAQMTRPAGFDFLPGQATDCNRNLIPDSCDITLGTSEDLNHNGIPDECESGVVCYANCDQSTASPVLNVNDFTCFLQRFAAGEAYANCDGSTTVPVLNVTDFTCFLERYAAGCE